VTIAPPLTLAISTSSPALSIALVEGETVLARHHALIGRGHAEALVPAIADLLGERRPARIIIDTGPGSYTGIRIGIAAARALGLAWGVEVLGASSLSLVAAQAITLSPGLPGVWALIDAGRGQVAGGWIGPDLVSPPPSLVRSAPEGATLAGAGARLLPDAPAPVHDSHPDAGFAGCLGGAALGAPAALYVAD
jgi:tRNA threonylcarbamoyl adenosine modification protein YeaZ